jgi:hypothetical protein
VPARATPGSVDHFLAERYALYSTLGRRLLRVRVRHAPWVLHEAAVETLDETLTLAVAAGAPSTPALARCSRGVDVAVLAPEIVAGASRSGAGSSRPPSCR